MKRLLLPLTIIIAHQYLNAQEPADALRYSWNVPGGTARVKAIGGAIGSLGGDITSVFVNPAGIAFYKTGDFVLTPVYSFGNNKATYLGHNEKDKVNRFTWGTTGFVIGSDVNSKNHSSAFSIAYNRAADFNTNILYR